MRLYEFIKSKHDFSTLKSKFEEACGEAGIEVPESIEGYEYI